MLTFQVSSGRLSMVNCIDSFGNTALHVAAQTGQNEVAVYLLQQGLNTSTRNSQGIPAIVHMFK